MDILYTAGHDLTSEGIDTRFETRILHNDSLHPNRFADPFLRFFRNITVPKSEVFVFDFDDIGIHVERKRIFDHIFFHIAVRVFVDDLRTAGRASYDLVERHLIHVFGKPAEDDHFGALKLIHDQ